VHFNLVLEQGHACFDFNQLFHRLRLDRVAAFSPTLLYVRLKPLLTLVGARDALSPTAEAGASRSRPAAEPVQAGSPRALRCFADIQAISRCSPSFLIFIAAYTPLPETKLQLPQQYARSGSAMFSLADAICQQLL
jgi:hypothetical protein